MEASFLDRFPIPIALHRVVSPALCGTNCRQKRLLAHEHRVVPGEASSFRRSKPHRPLTPYGSEPGGARSALGTRALSLRSEVPARRHTNERRRGEQSRTQRPDDGTKVKYFSSTFHFCLSISLSLSPFGFPEFSAVRYLAGSRAAPLSSLRSWTSPSRHPPP